jgi:hypothetical protein
VSLEIISCEQGQEDWFRARMGIPTASEFATVMASGKGGAESKTRKTYMLKLAGELLTGEPMESYSNGHMERGKIMEEEARDAYCIIHSATPQKVGFLRNGQKGCSPDSLLDANGMLEIKTKLPHLMIECLLKDEFPADHKAQCQGALWVAEREWIDIAVYWPRLPLFVKRAYRDEVYIKNLSNCIDEFNLELFTVVQRIRGYAEAA